MPTLRPGLGPSFRASRMTRASGHAAARYAPVPSVLAISTTMIRAGAQPASATDCRVVLSVLQVVVRDDHHLDVRGKIGSRRHERPTRPAPVSVAAT